MTTTDDRTIEEPTVEIDTQAAEEFAGRLVGVLNDSCLAVMTSIGYQTGLFDAMSRVGAATSADIAAASSLNERYVREWLGAMTTARVVVHDPDHSSYFLPPEHAASLTAVGPENLARTMQLVTMLAEVEQPIIECFRRGGGLPYSAYPRFHRLMAEDSAAGVDAGLVDVVVPLVDGLTDRLRAGIDVADIGCGSGHAINVLAQNFPASTFTGLDFSDEAIAAARAEAAALGLTNAHFEVRDAATPAGSGSYDMVTAFDAIHDQAHPAAVLSNVHDLLRPGGVFLMVDIKASSHVSDNVDSPFGTFLYTASTLHCMSVSLGLDGDGLGTAWGEQLALTMLADAGFEDVVVKEIESDPFNNYYVCARA